jgi:hypothetical protein
MMAAASICFFKVYSSLEKKPEIEWGSGKPRHDAEKPRETGWRISGKRATQSGMSQCLRSDTAKAASFYGSYHERRGAAGLKLLHFIKSAPLDQVFSAVFCVRPIAAPMAWGA